MSHDCREAHRVQVVQRGLFATPNSLKSHKGQKVLSPLVQYSCRNAKVVHAFDANTRRKTPGIRHRATKSPLPSRTAVPSPPMTGACRSAGSLEVREPMMPSAIL